MEMSASEIIIRREKLNCRIHINPELEIIVVESGSLTVIGEGESLIVNKGETAIVPPYRLHGFVCDDGIKAAVLIFSQTITGDFQKKYRAYNRGNKKMTIEPQIAEFTRYSLSKFYIKPDNFIARSVFYALASAFADETEEDVVPQKRSGLSVQEVVEYIFVHLTEELSLNQVAGAFNTNRNTFSEFFRDNVGITFNEFLKNVRIERAERMLLTSDKTITEIAYECGFGCVRSFNRAFLKCFGCSPTEFLKK